MSISPLQPHQVIDKHDMEKLISRNLLITVLSKIFNLITRIFLPPLTLSFVSLDEYGIWAICFTIVTYLNLGAFGVTNVYVKYVAEYHAKDEIDKINGLLSTGTVLVTFILLMSLIPFIFFLDFIVEKIFVIPPELHQTAYFLFLGTACMFIFQLSFGGFMRMLNGLQKIAETTWIFIITLIVETILIILLLFQGLGIYALLYALIVRYLISTVAYIALSYYFVPGLSIHLKHFSPSYFKVFYRFGAILQLSGMIGIFLNTIDKILSSTLLNMQATALLGLGTRLPSMVVTIPSAMSAVYLPATSYMHSQQRQQEMIDVYLQGSRTTGLITGFMMGYIAAFSAPLIVAWLGTKPEYQIVATLMTVFTLSQHWHVLTGPGSSFFKGIDKPGNNLTYSFSRLFFTGLSIFLILHFWGITILNIAIAIAIGTLLSATLYLINNNWKIGVKQTTFLTQAILPGLMPYFIAYLLFLLMLPWLEQAMHNRWHALGFILIGGTIYTLCTATLIYRFIFKPEEQDRWRNKIKRILRLVFRLSPKNKKPPQQP